MPLLLLLLLVRGRRAGVVLADHVSSELLIWGGAVAASSGRGRGGPGRGGGHRGNYPGRGEGAIFVVAHPPAPVVPAASGIRVTHLDSELNPQARAAINAAVATLDDPAAAAPVPAQPRFLRKNNNLLLQKK